MQLNLAAHFLVRPTNKFVVKRKRLTIAAEFEVNGSKLGRRSFDNNSVVHPAFPCSPTDMKNVLILEHQCVAVQMYILRGGPSVGHIPGP